MAETSERSDIELVNAAKGGDYDAFEALTVRYQDRVYRLALGMTKSPQDAEEVMEEAFLNIFRNIESFRGDSSPGSWIYRVAANAALMKLRTRRRKPLLSIEDSLLAHADAERGNINAPGPWARQPDEKLLDKELGDYITRAIEQLPEKYRMVLLLRDVEEQSNEEVARPRGLTVPTVKSRLYRSRLFVRDQLEQYFSKD
jgi:RNA polymerase sigma-70 factor (ECF subfamily)